MRQTYQSWELLLIDDGSTDSTAQVMNLYRGDERVRIFRTENVGLLRVANLALREARGEYIIRLDGDDVFDENILLVLQANLEQHPDAALAFPDYYLIDEFGEVFGHERRVKFYESNHLLDVPPHGACTLVRTAVLREIGGYDETLGAQDGFYLWRKVSEKYRAININLPLFYYRRHGKNLTRKVNKIAEARRQIKRDTRLVELDQCRPFTAVIPCRRNYDFHADLWRVEFDGQPLLQRALRACTSSKLFDHIVVTCDNPEAEAIADAAGDSRVRFSLREPKDTLRSRSIVPVLERLVREFDPEMKGVTVLSKIQTPFISSDTLEEALFTLVTSDADCSIGVVELEVPVFRRSSFGLEAVAPRREITSDFDKLYAESRSVMCTRNRNFPRGSLTGPSVINFTVNPDEVFFIDTLRDYHVASAIKSWSRVFT